MKELKSNSNNDETTSAAPAIESSVKALQAYLPGTFARSVCKVSKEQPASRTLSRVTESMF